MKKTKKIFLGLCAGLGISSLIAVGCGLAFSNANITNQTINNANTANLVNQNKNNILPKNANDSTTNKSTLNNPNAPTSSKNSSNSQNNNLNNNFPSNNATIPNITNANKLPYYTLDSATIASATNNTFTYQCSNGNNLLFSVNTNNVNTVTLLGFGGKVVSTNLIIPNTVVNANNFYAVTNIAGGAFYGQQLTSVTFNSNLLSIGTLAFANNNLTSLSLPPNLQSIGDQAFISNSFPHAYAVYLPNNVSWSKNWLTCPFGNPNNLSKLVNGVQFVIQGNAVYEFQANQNAWVIVSYDVTNVTSKNDDWATATGSWSRQTYTNVSQKTVNLNPAKNVNVNLATSFNGNLSNFCLYTQNQWKGIGWIFYFNPTNSTFNVFIRNNNGTNNYLFGNGVSTTFDISLYDPYAGQYLFNWHLNANAQSVPQTTFKYQPGDILTYSVNNSQSNAWAYIASNFNSSLLTNNTFLNGSATATLNKYIDLSYAWTKEHGLASHFAIKPTGIYPTTATANLSNVSYNPTTGALNLQGTSLPNMQFAVDYNNTQVGTFSTNSNGIIDTSNNELIIPKNLSATDDFTIVALKSTSNNTNVIYPAPYTTHLQGFNPKESFIELSLDGTNTKILFDGFTNSLAVANISTTWPAYATSDGNYSTDALTTSSTFGGSGELNINITNDSGELVKSSSFDFTSGEAVSKLYTFLDSLPYENGYTYTFLGNGFSFSNIFDNGVVVGYGSSIINHVNQSSFLVNANGITCTTTQTMHDGYLGAVNEYYGSGANSRRWNATYGWLACNSGDIYTTDYNHENWYNPNQLMVEVAKQIADTYSNPVNEVMALFDWTYNNIYYGTSADGYYEPVRGYFQHLEGVCANISDVFGALLKIDGFVSRQVWGSVDSINVNLVQSQMMNDLDHEWTQVWMPSLQEWITLDPTWDWALPFGDLESQFNIDRCDMTINVVEWPENGTGLYYDSYGTLSYHNYAYDNYFSYFKGCEYEALLNLGRDFDILPGMNQNTYQYSYALALAQIINWAANPKNSISNNSYVLDYMYPR